MNDVVPVANDLIRSGQWLPSPWLLWVIFFFTLVLFFGATAMLYHHWNEYVIDEKKRALAKALYIRFSSILLLGMVITLLF